MTELNAYELACIAGGFTAVGALIGVACTYWLALKLEQSKDRRLAAAAFRAAFAYVLGQIYLARHHGTHDCPVVGDILKEALGRHAEAVEIFRPFVMSADKYQEDWEKYRQCVRQSNNSIDTAEWGTDDPKWSTVESQINVLLTHATSVSGNR